MTDTIPLPQAKPATWLQALSTEKRARRTAHRRTPGHVPYCSSPRTGLFLDARNLTNLLTEMAPLLLIAVAATLMIIQGEIDLSVGSIAGFTGALLAWLLAHDQVPSTIAVLVTFTAGTAATLLQGLIVVLGHVRSFAVTLAGYFIWYGVQLWILGPRGYEAVRRRPIATLAARGCRRRRRPQSLLSSPPAASSPLSSEPGSESSAGSRLSPSPPPPRSSVVAYLEQGGGVPAGLRSRSRGHDRRVDSAHPNQTLVVTCTPSVGISRLPDATASPCLG